MKTAELCRKHGISDGTFYSWKAKYDGMTVSEAAVADVGRREPAAEEAAGGVDAGRVRAEGSVEKRLTRSVDHYAAVEKLMADHGLSEPRACRLTGVNRSAWQYEPLRGKDDAVRERMREIANGAVGSAVGS
ncbi:transposase [Sphingomonas oryzagri]